MSYTVYLHKSQDTINDWWGNSLKEGVDYIRVSNITFNLREMFNFAFSNTTTKNDLYWVDVLHKKNCGNVSNSVRGAILTLESEETQAKTYEAPNGWGTYEGALRFLTEVLDSCSEYPEWFIEISK